MQNNNPSVRCVRIGTNTINLQNFLFARAMKTKGTNSKGEFSEVYLLKFFFNDKVTLELQFDTQEACQAAHEFLDAATGATIVMPDAILQAKDKEANDATQEEC